MQARLRLITSIERCVLQAPALHSYWGSLGEAMSEDKKYYVYLHRIIGTNEVFNVGSGSGKRMKIKTSRSKIWQNITSNNGWCYTLVKENLSQSEAQGLEVELIKIYKPRANIHQTTIEAKSLDVDSVFIKSRFYYDNTSPTFLRYREGNNQVGKLRRVAGDIAGRTLSGRYVIDVGGFTRMVHRVIWYLLKADDPIGFVIDHIDGNSLNNNIDNLRKVTQKENSRNTGFNKNNKTGYKGVSETAGFYMGYYNVSGKAVCKSFSKQKHGKELALALALEYRFNSINSAVAEDGPYTLRHIGEYKRLPALNNYTESQIKEMLVDDKRASNTTGFKGLYFIQYDKGLSILVKKQKQGVINRAEFDTTKLGLMPAFNAALLWLDKHK